MDPIDIGSVPQRPLIIKDNILYGSVGIETLGGKFLALINEGTQVPCQHSETFSTTSDNQEVIEIHVFQGTAQRVKSNDQVGIYKIRDIPRANKGVPQIEVTFRVSEDGSFILLARNLCTNEQMEVTNELEL